MGNVIIDKLNKFFTVYPLIKVKKGEILLDANQQPTGIFYIESGLVRRYWIFENGSEVTLNMYKPHTFLPMSWAISDIPNIHIYEAMSDVVVRKAPKEDVLKFLQKEPDIVYDLLRRMYIGMEGLWSHIQSLTNGNSLGKLVATLVILGKRFGKKVQEKIELDLTLTEQELASYAGISRETASRELQKLKKSGVISMSKGTVVIENIDKLESLVTQ